MDVRRRVTLGSTTLNGIMALNRAYIYIYIYIRHGGSLIMMPATVNFLRLRHFSAIGYVIQLYFGHVTDSYVTQ